MIAIHKFSVWQQNGTPIKHLVTEVSSEGVCTWSEPLTAAQETEHAAGGFSYFGPAEHFISQFTFLRPAPHV